VGRSAVVVKRSSPTCMDPDWTEIARFVGKTSSPDEDGRVRLWSDADPAHRRFLKLVAPESAVSLTPVPARDRAPVSARSRRRRSPFSAGALALIMLVLAGIGVVALDKPWLAGPITGTTVVAWKEISVQNGEKATFVLRDNTRLTIAPGTVVRVREDFGQANRIIELEGHALFEVDSPPGAPQLQVRAGGLVIENAGTVFDVSAYGDQDVHVVVAKGAINVMPAGADTLYLPAGMMGTIARGTQRIRTRRVNPDSYLSWTRGEISFNNAALLSVAHELERWYAVPFVFEDDAMSGIRLTATFNTRQSLHQVLEALNISLGLEASLIGNRVLLRYPNKHHEAEVAT